MTEKFSKVRVRFAPSPTGFLHIGSLRTALFSFLFARHHRGKHILRIEDTDRARYIEGSIENLLKVMKELKIEFDEGAFADSDGKIKEKGNFGPYLQSERVNIYKKYALQLVKQGDAYYCFCNEKRLGELKKEQIALKKPAMYDGECRKLPEKEIEKRIAECREKGKEPVIRQAIPEEGETVIKDLVYGEIRFEHKILDDQVLLKSDGFPTYHLAVVVDDHLMEITHVIRGEEWISSTPKHVLLYKAFGWKPTEYAHLPLILNPDKTKLSKRQGDVSVEDFLSKGYLKEALINFVAFLGWNPKNEKEIFSLEELIEKFSLEKVNKSGAVFDTNKLDWINGQYIRNKTDEELTLLLLPYWKRFGVDTKKYKEEYLRAIVSLEKDRLKKLSEIGERTGYFFTEPEYEKDLLVWRKSNERDAKEKLKLLKEFFSKLPEEKFTKENLEQKLKNFIEKNNSDNGSVLWPLRVCLTGAKASPGPFEVASALALGLGKQEIINRIEKAISKLQPSH